MRTLKKIKLNHYADEQLKEREMNLLRGGNDEIKICVCYVNNPTNADANYNNGLTTSTGEGECWCVYGGTLHKNDWNDTNNP